MKKSKNASYLLQSLLSVVDRADGLGFICSGYRSSITTHSKGEWNFLWVNQTFRERPFCLSWETSWWHKIQNHNLYLFRIVLAGAHPEYIPTSCPGDYFTRDRTWGRGSVMMVDSVSFPLLVTKHITPAPSQYVAESLSTYFWLC